MCITKKMLKKLFLICWMSFLLEISHCDGPIIDNMIDDLYEELKNEYDLTPSKILKRLAEKIASEDKMTLTPYQYSYKTDTSSREEMGISVNGEPMVVGAYTVTDPNGSTIMTTYTADKNGYRPKVSFHIRNKKLLNSAVGK